MLTGKYINGYYKKYLWCFVLGISVLICVDILHIVEPRKLGEVVELLGKLNLDPANQDIIDQITHISCLIFGIAGLMFVGRVIWRYSLFFAATRIEADLRRKMFEKAERLSPHYYHNNSVGNIINWFTSDLEEILDFFKWGTIQIVDAGFLLTLVLIMMFILCPKLTLILLIPILGIAVWSFFSEKLFTEKWKLRQDSTDKIYDYAQESFTGIRVIKAFVKHRQQIKAFSKIALKSKDIDISVTRFFLAFERFIELFIHLIFAFLVGFGGYLVFQNLNGKPVWGISLSIKDLVTYIGYFDTILWPIFALGSVISSHGRAKACLMRITSFLDAEEDIQNNPNPIHLKNSKGQIEFKHLNFKYPSMTSNHLKDINFVINPGESIGVVGRIGCGKSTISNLICRLYNPNPGELFIDDIDVLNIDLSDLRDAIAYVPQDNFLFSDTIEENIAFGKHNSNKEEIIEAAQFSSVHDDILSFKRKYKTLIGERGTTLSGGQKQRISMARAYLKDAPIMIMDDSVSAVDIKTEEKILESIKLHRKGKTTLIIASRVSTVSKLDKVLVLNDGVVEAFGSPKELLKKSPTYAKMHLLQELEREKEGGK